MESKDEQSNESSRNEVGRKTANRGGKRGGKRRRTNKPRKGAVKPADVQFSEDFVQYYKGHVVPAEDWDAFTASIRTPLPTAFRINVAAGERERVLAEFEEKRKDLEALHVSGEGGEAELDIKLSQVSWFPYGVAFTLPIARKELKHTPAYDGLRKWLIRSTESGSVCRQEVVSMVPPLLLDVQPYHAVLDMCAAPGTKTEQLLELMHCTSKPSPAQGESDIKFPSTEGTSGMLIANDLDKGRSYMLAHLCRKIGNTSLCVINEDATKLSLRAFAGLEEKGNEEGVFDRILADVPCGGDGTFRKASYLVGEWTPENGAKLHSLQLNIAMRGLSMLKVNGRMVYSTCSLNPSENEAVVAEILRRSKGAIAVVDVSGELPGLVRRPGLTQWQTPLDLKKQQQEVKKVPKWYSKSLEPPIEEEAAIIEQLKHCLRMFPQDNDSGGFFVTVLKKVAPIASVVEEQFPIPVVETPSPAAQPEESKDAAQGKGSKVKRRQQENFLEKPFAPAVPLIRQQLQHQFGIEDSFPWHLLYARSPKVPSSVYLLHPLARRLVDGQLPEGSSDARSGVPGVNRRLNIVNTGGRLFDWGRDKKQADWYRVMQSGVHIVAPYLRRRIVLLPLQDLRALANSVGGAGVVPFDDLSAEGRENAAQAPHGPVVFLQLRSSTQAPTPAAEGDPHGPVWSTYTHKEDHAALVARLPLGKGQPAICGWVLGQTLKTAVSVDDKPSVLAAIDRADGN